MFQLSNFWRNSKFYVPKNSLIGPCAYTRLNTVILYISDLFGKSYKINFSFFYIQKRIIREKKESCLLIHENKEENKIVLKGSIYFNFMFVAIKCTHSSTFILLSYFL